MNSEHSSNGNDAPARIKVRNFANLSRFANIEDESAGNEETNVITITKQSQNIEIICVSSDDDCKPSPPKKTKRKSHRSVVRLNRKVSKEPLQHKYHKISDYFSAAKIERDKADRNEEVADVPENCSTAVGTSIDNNANDKTSKSMNVPTKKRKQSKANTNRTKKASKKSDSELAEPPKTKNPQKFDIVKRTESGAVITRELTVVLKRLDVIKRFDVVGADADKNTIQQAKLTNYIDDIPSRDAYFHTHEEAAQPTATPSPTVTATPKTRAQFMVRIENQSESKPVFEKNKPIKGEQSIDLSPLVINVEDAISNDSVSPTSNGNSNDIGLEQNNLYCDVKDEELVADEDNDAQNIEVTRRITRNKTSTKTENAIKGRKKPKCPSYKVINETMSVDAFRYGDIDGVKYYFLSHFHADHYIGLKKSFKHALYTSEITARLAIQFIKVNPDNIKTMPIGTSIIVDDTEVIALEANHCPGAVMFLFKFISGKCYLHTGDFRADPSMEEYPEFWNNSIDTIYLDTTYLSKKYDFCTQSESIQKVVEDCRKYHDRHIGGHGKTLIVCGSYKIGKEKVWLAIAQAFNLKVWIDKERKNALKCIDNKDMLDVIVDSPLEANIHVLPINEINYKRLVRYLDMFNDQFSRLLAFRPSGWEKNTKPSLGSRVTIVGVQYSEHSSFNELKRFVRFIKPRKVISTVPFSSKNMEKTPKVPHSWLNYELKPNRATGQTNIMDYMKRSASKPLHEVQLNYCEPSIESIHLHDSDSDWMS